ncbi:MAG: branched-chain amino acid ABC transporter permease [Oscillibacter sp.]|nr:branched-chain amino acid ABC transporter permease [Oscillibacter sp.]
MIDKKKLLTPKNILVTVVLLILALLPIFPTTGAYAIQLTCLTMLFIYWASAYNIIGGFAGHTSLGHACYVGIGAYVAVMLYLYGGISPWIGMFIAGIVAAVIAGIIGYVTFHMRGSYYTLSSVALLNCFRIAMAASKEIFGFKTGGAVGLKISWMGESVSGMQFVSKVPFYYIFLVFMILCVLLCWYIKNSKMGYYLAAITTNQDAASSLGVNIMQYKLMALCSSAFLMALGGAVYAFFLTSIDPLSMFNYDTSARIMLMTVVGGLGTLWGPVLGAALLVPLNEWMRASFGARLSGLSFVIYGIILMLVVMFLPKGLVSLKDKYEKRRYEKQQAKEVAVKEASVHE